MTTITSCRGCGSGELHSVLDLGLSPLANALGQTREQAVASPRHPLHTVWCQHCALLQITENVPPADLFSHYVYFSSVSSTVVERAKALATAMTHRRHLHGKSLVLEVASNDGYLLRHYRDLGVPVLGIEPAKNIAEQANASGIPTRPEFFGSNLGRRLAAEGVQADVVHMHNAFPHVADPVDVAAGLEAVLKPGGVLILEFAYAIDTINACEFDQIYHEHVCYFSLTSLQKLLNRVGLAVQDVERLDIHGGSLRVSAMRIPEAVPTEAVEIMFKNEQEWGVHVFDTYRSFGQRVNHLCQRLRDQLQQLSEDGKRMGIYGASAKGTTLLHAIGVSPDMFAYAVDRSPYKQGSHLPGTGILVRSPEVLIEEPVDVLLLLTWNFAQEIFAQQRGFFAAGGQFLVPIPEPHLVAAFPG